MHANYQSKHKPVESLKTVFDGQSPIKVFSDYFIIKNNVTDSRFQITEDPLECQIAWVTVDYYHLIRK